MSLGKGRRQGRAAAGQVCGQCRLARTEIDWRRLTGTFLPVLIIPPDKAVGEATLAGVLFFCVGLALTLQYHPVRWWLTVKTTVLKRVEASVDSFSSRRSISSIVRRSEQKSTRKMFFLIFHSESHSGSRDSVRSSDLMNKQSYASRLAFSLTTIPRLFRKSNILPRPRCGMLTWVKNSIFIDSRYISGIIDFNCHTFCPSRTFVLVDCRN